MEPRPQSVEATIALGQARLEQLREIAALPATEFLPRLAALPWIRVKEVFDHPLTDPGGFYPSLLEFVDLLEGIVLRQRGPGILGHLDVLELSFSMHAQASYAPDSRVVRVELGLPLFANELEATYGWLDSVLFGGTGVMSVDDVARQVAPAAVRSEVSALLRAGSEGLPVSRKRGLEHPIGRALLRFVLAHELGHLIDAAESAGLQASWRQAVWTHYEDALSYARTAGWLPPARYLGLQRLSLPRQTADRWAAEFVADSLGFYTVSELPPPGDIGTRDPHAVLQAAVELFFHAVAASYQADAGSDTHPPPLLRSTVIRAGQRASRGVDWSTFLSEHWGAGLVTSELLFRVIREVGGRR